MLLLRCSLPADSMSRSTSFWPSTIATRSSSAWVALKSIRFIVLSPALGHGRGPGFPVPDGDWPDPDRRGSSEVDSWMHHWECARDDFWFSSSSVRGVGRGGVKFVVRRARVIRLPSLLVFAGERRLPVRKP